MTKIKAYTSSTVLLASVNVCNLMGFVILLFHFGKFLNSPMKTKKDLSRLVKTCSYFSLFVVSVYPKLNKRMRSLGMFFFLNKFSSQN